MPVTEAFFTSQTKMTKELKRKSNQKRIQGKSSTKLHPEGQEWDAS